MKPQNNRPSRRMLLVGLTAVLSIAAGGEETTRIERVENGLLPPILLQGQEPQRMSLGERQEHYQVRGLSVAIIDDFEIAWAKGYGVVLAGGEQAVTTDTLFQAGSISKPVAALVALRMVAAGRVALEDPVNGRLTSWQLPDSPAGGLKPVRLHHLLTHSAGLEPHTFPPAASNKKPPPLVELLAPVVKRVEPPGLRFAYSNPAFGLLEQLLVDAAGQPFEQLARKEIFVPLGMTGSSFAAVLPPPLLARAAHGHDRDGAPIDGKGTIVPAALGGLWTTPTDLCRFLLAVFQANRSSADFLPRQLAAGMVTRQFEDRGLGTEVAGIGEAPRIQHGGGLPGFSAFFVGYPATGQGAVVMNNSGRRGWRMMHEIIRSVAVEYGWPDYVHRRQVVATSPEAFAAYAGDYEFEYNGLKMKIYAKGGLFYRGTYEMLPVSETMFVVPKAGDELEFIRDATGRVTGFDYGQPGTRKIRARRIEP